MSLTENLSPRERDLLRAVRTWAGDFEVTTLSERRFAGCSNSNLARQINAKIAALPDQFPDTAGGYRWVWEGARWTSGGTQRATFRIATASRRTSLRFTFTMDPAVRPCEGNPPLGDSP